MCRTLCISVRFYLVTLLLTTISCGVKGPPIAPPAPIIPTDSDNLQVRKNSVTKEYKNNKARNEKSSEQTSSVQSDVPTLEEE